MLDFESKGGFMAAKEHEVLENYITQHNLKITKQRRAVLEAFLGSDEHVSAEDLYKIVSAKEPKIGLATVYRTLALLTESGLPPSWISATARSATNAITSRATTIT